MTIFIGVDRNKNINLRQKLMLKNIIIIFFAFSMCQENHIFQVMTISQSSFSLNKCLVYSSKFKKVREIKLTKFIE